MKNLSYEKVEEILAKYKADKNITLPALVVSNAEPDNERDIQILKDILETLDVYRHPNWFVWIMNKFTESKIIDWDYRYNLIRNLPDIAFYISRSFNAICKFCLAKEVRFYYDKFDRCLYTKNNMHPDNDKMEYVIEYMLKYPVPSDVFVKWTKFSTSSSDNTFWLAVMYAANGNNHYMNILTNDYFKHFQFSLTISYTVCRNTIKGYDDAIEDGHYNNKIDIARTISALYTAVRKCKNNSNMPFYKDIVFLNTPYIYKSLGLTEEMINDIIAECLGRNSFKATCANFEALLFVCKICGFRLNTEVILKAFDVMVNWKNYNISNIKIEFVNINEFINMLKYAKDISYSFITEEMLDYILSTYYNSIRIHCTDPTLLDLIEKKMISLDQKKIAHADKPIVLLSMFIYIKGRENCTPPYDLLERTIRANNLEEFGYEYYVMNILTSYPKSVIDKDVMIRWSNSDNEVLRNIGKAYLYHADPRFSYTDKWAMLFNKDNPDRDIKIDSTTEVYKEGSFDSVIYGTIPDDAIIRECNNGAYRTNKFHVTHIDCKALDYKMAFSRMDSTFCYKVGETIVVEDFDPTNNIGEGIYFNIDG